MWHTHARTHTSNGPFPGIARWAGTRKVKPVWILLKQKTMSGSGISWAICKTAPCSRQITTPLPYHSVFYRQDARHPATQPTASKHWRHNWHNVVRTHLLQYLHNKTFRINHPYPLNSILLCGAFFTHCRHQQVCYADGSLAHTATQTPAARNTQ